MRIVIPFNQCIHLVFQTENFGDVEKELACDGLYLESKLKGYKLEQPIELIQPWSRKQVLGTWVSGRA